MSKSLTYYTYVSRAKVLQLHDQLKDFTTEKKSVRRRKAVEGKGEASAIFGFLKGGLSAGGRHEVEVEETGDESVVQKLAVVLNHIAENEKVLDLKQLCTDKAGVKLDAFCYIYEGSFYSLATLDHGEKGLHIPAEALDKSRDEIILSKELLIEPGRKENALSEVGPNNSSVVSDMAIICSEIEDYTLRLACSLKYFSDMGGSYDEGDNEWYVMPHSGNYHFFAGEVEAHFRSVLFLNGIRGNTIMGTPLCLQLSPDPDLYL